MISFRIAVPVLSTNAGRRNADEESNIAYGSFCVDAAPEPGICTIERLARPRITRQDFDRLGYAKMTIGTLEPATWMMQ
jgi:hypothetical protein